jgi:hypothetical protein
MKKFRTFLRRNLVPGICYRKVKSPLFSFYSASCFHHYSGCTTSVLLVTMAPGVMQTGQSPHPGSDSKGSPALGCFHMKGARTCLVSFPSHYVPSGTQMSRKPSGNQHGTDYRPGDWFQNTGIPVS